jgi:hypothetical protein
MRKRKLTLPSFLFNIMANRFSGCNLLIDYESKVVFNKEIHLMLVHTESDTLRDP